jgi:EamA domain-containing membrane protein RarD
MIKIMCVLIATGALGMFFSATRKISLLCVALLVFLYPIITLGLIVVVGGTGLYMYRRKVE